ncbi:hypothetical protein ACNOYE_11900 [Nannocystaceae bacterium ST9]
MPAPYHDSPVFSRPSRATRNYADVFRPLRTLISLTVLAGMVWFSFAVQLGDKTLAEHVDTISDTPEAKQLLEGTRQTVNPAIEDVRDRMLGEYVEAPTFIAHDPLDEVVPASSLPPEPARPGRRPPRAEPIDDEIEDLPEPARPGRRLRPNVLVAEPALVVEPEPEPPPALPRMFTSPPAPRPIALRELPLPRAEHDRSFLAPMLELARSVPPAREPTPVPIVRPVIEPELPELPGAR